MEILSGNCIKVIPLNVLMVNCIKDDREKFLDTIEWLKDFIKTSTGFRSILREVDELIYSSSSELYIPAYVIRTSAELKSFAQEYKKIGADKKVNILPFIIINSDLYENPSDRKYIDRAQNAVYIKKQVASGFLCFFSAKYERRTVNSLYMQKLILYLNEIMNQEAAIRIPTLENEMEYDPDYVSMRSKIKTLGSISESKTLTLDTNKNPMQSNMKSLLDTNSSYSTAKVRPFNVSDSFNFDSAAKNRGNNFDYSAVKIRGGSMVPIIRSSVDFERKTKHRYTDSVRSSYSTVRLSQNLAEMI